ncbi:MAG: glycosyltransferase [Salinarimonadaceae bacterium]|nr:MAG: glycosyltransferase [Salinarimonadaceae bacterium]
MIAELSRPVGKPRGHDSLLVPLLTRRAKLEHVSGLVLWLAALVYFWIWWLRPEHNVNWTNYLIVTAVLAWITLLPGYFLIIFASSRKTRADAGLPTGLRIAMVVTKAPSEPFAVVERTLRAMLAQDHPHDTWLADEDPAPATIAWCRAHGVSLSTRKDAPEYHRENWPRRTRCKEGNLAYFYDHFGYARYDIVAQLDADHIPEPGYLREMIKPFGDPRVGYVSAPSICDLNARESWSARGRLYAEASMHGSLQAGYNNGWAPLCIGSHYAVRTAALREIGGLGPELAEDHSTTLMMNARGWRGVHALDAIAHGDGPRTFTDLVTQEFQWSRSLVSILLRYTPRHLPALPARLKFQFLFSQLWYPLFAVFMAIMFLMPIVALTSNTPFAGVTFPVFMLHFAPLSIVLILMAFRWRATGSFRPVDAKILGWETVIFLLARWPWALAGCLAALRDWISGGFVDFRVTPKGVLHVDPLPVRVVAPYAILSIASALPVLLVEDPGQAGGFYIFAIINAIVYAIVFLVIVFKHERENAVRRSSPLRLQAVVATITLLLALPVTGASMRGTQGLEALSYGVASIAMTQTSYSPAGAGRAGTRIIRLAPRWVGEAGR